MTKLKLNYIHFQLESSYYITPLMQRVSSFITRFGWFEDGDTTRLSRSVFVYARACVGRVENRYGRSTHTSAHVLAVRPLSYYLALCFNAPAKQAFGDSQRAFERQWNNYVNRYFESLFEALDSTQLTHCCGLQM